MSPNLNPLFGASYGGPRASGDEPLEQHLQEKGYTWSPRERG